MRCTSGMPPVGAGASNSSRCEPLSLSSHSSPVGVEAVRAACAMSRVAAMVVVSSPATVRTPSSVVRYENALRMEALRWEGAEVRRLVSSRAYMRCERFRDFPTSAEQLHRRGRREAEVAEDYVTRNDNSSRSKSTAETQSRRDAETQRRRGDQKAPWRILWSPLR